MTVAVFSTLAAISLPVMTDLTADIKVAEAARLVERELQDARLRAVSSNRSLRVRMNCPATGALRTVEVLGTTADTASDRCLLAAYPFPAADDNITTRPNYDGPVRPLPLEAAVGSSIIEFRPDGTAYNIVSGVAQSISTPLTITITRRNKSRSLTVNGIGKIQLQ